MLKLSVEIDTSSSESLGKTVAALRAGAEYAGVPFQSCVLIAGSQSGVSGAEQIGMPCIVLRSSFIDDAYQEGIPVVILTAYSKSGDKIAGSIIEKLGHERISKVNIIGNEEVKQSSYGQLVTQKGLSLGLDEQLAKEAIKLRNKK